ncbi:DUF4232 domain-containing protein [Jatrophihabitans sp.]|uniref:DUF4232 domain-containing protein n=1 Tax=Jatrophihabitans sp. TaxID=1932789 RepID=UPI0030C7238C|nr:hypothetical protein [Jatrophihabitans sp.]
MATLRARLLTLAATGALAATGLAVAAGPAAASTAACGNSSLAVTAADPEGATGHGSLTLLFRNISHSTCTLYGYPGLDALNSAGHEIAHATRTLHGYAGGANSLKTVTVKPDYFASAVVEWMNFNPKTSGPCTISKYLAATPANTSHTVRLTESVSLCDLQVHPTVSGSGGNSQFGYAQAQWLAGSKASAAAEGGYWAKAEKDLKVDGSRYSTAIGELKTLIALPNTSLTPAQIKTARKVTTELDDFFQMPGLYS